MANDFYCQQSCNNKTQTKRRRWSKWHQEPLFTQLKKAVRSVRFERKTVTEACRESLPCEGCTQRIPHRTLTRHVAMSRDEPGTFLYMPPNEHESRTKAMNAKRMCQRPVMTTTQSTNCGGLAHPSKFSDSTQFNKLGASNNFTRNSNVGVATQANTQSDGVAVEHNNLGVSSEHNTFGTTTEQEDFAWLDNLEQPDISQWPDSEFSNDQTKCVDPCLLNQEDQLDGCSNSFSCSAQGDWGAYTPGPCAPSRMDCVVASPPPLCRDNSCSSLLSNLSLVDNWNTDSDMNTGDDAGDFSCVCDVDDLLSSPVLSGGFLDFE